MSNKSLKKKKSITYKESGVDIDAGTEAVSRIKKHVGATFNENVLTDIGGFGGCFDLIFGQFCYYFLADLFREKS